MAWHRGQAYAQDLRDRVLGARGSIREVAARFGVSESYVANARSRRRRLGDEKPGVQCNHVRPRLAGLEGALSARIAQAPDLTLKQLCQWVEVEHGVHVAPTTMWKTLARLGLSLKKSRSMRPSKNAPT